MAETDDTYIIYPFTPNEGETKSYSVDMPNGEEGSYKVDVRFHMFTQRWYFKITCYQKKQSISTEWRALTSCPTLNFSYQNVMPYSVGFQTLTGMDPEDDIDMNTGEFYLISWDDLEFALE